MNKSIWIALGAMALVVAAGGVGGITLTGAEMRVDRYPSVQQDIGDHLELGFLSSGILRETGAYRTGDDPQTVAGWYQFRDHLQPTRSLQQADACVRLEKEADNPVARLTLIVSLCPNGQGTRVSFSRQLTLAR
jgi:hypothetical protein